MHTQVVAPVRRHRFRRLDGQTQVLVRRLTDRIGSTPELLLVLLQRQVVRTRRVTAERLAG